MKATVVNIKNGDDYDVDIRRPGPWGNPYLIGPALTRREAIEKYRSHIKGQPDLLARLSELKGKRLGCICAPMSCHGDVLAELADKITDERNDDEL